jgi:hypothetical protein
MGPIQRFIVEEARHVGTALGVNWQQVDPEQFRRGMEVELEHGTRDSETNVTGDDLNLIGKIAWAHLKEYPDYYTRLDALEARPRHTGRRCAIVADMRPASLSGSMSPQGHDHGQRN